MEDEKYSYFEKEKTEKIGEYTVTYDVHFAENAYRCEEIVEKVRIRKIINETGDLVKLSKYKRQCLNKEILKKNTEEGICPRKKLSLDEKVKIHEWIQNSFAERGENMSDIYPEE